MWRTCAALCLAAGVVGQVFGGDSPGRTGDYLDPSKGFVYVGICDGKRVESGWAFRDCEELRTRPQGLICLSGIDDETLARLSEEGRLRGRAEEARIRDRPLWRVVRDALHPFLRVH